MATPIITFISDFGLDDWFVGVVHGVIEQVHPGARVVDLTHTIPPGNVARAAYVLAAAAADFPAGTVHLAVVDPGVGTDRRALAVRAHDQFFVGPDNGILEWAFTDPKAAAHSLTETRWFRAPVSRTFHGRDVFAPVAAHLASGVPLASLGPRIRDPERRPPDVVRREDGALVGRIMFIDRFGNALTNLRSEEIAQAFPGPEGGIDVRVSGRRIHGITRSYGDAKVGDVVAILGSSGCLEIAQVGGDVAERLGLGAGDRVWVGRALGPAPSSLAATR